ncbi:hypothetical protein ACLI09_05910 [Flavobacterium sp. RHBU_24]|uniref:hypothetical protein n=1 Tax=Flavobacterium sp. RHBU_24 TaxID=3391185 RepID=UPI00398471C7
MRNLFFIIVFFVALSPQNIKAQQLHGTTEMPTNGGSHFISYSWNANYKLAIEGEGQAQALTISLNKGRVDLQPHSEYVYAGKHYTKADLGLSAWPSGIHTPYGMVVEINISVNGKGFKKILDNNGRAVFIDYVKNLGNDPLNNVSVTAVSMTCNCASKEIQRDLDNMIFQQKNKKDLRTNSTSASTTKTATNVKSPVTQSVNHDENINENKDIKDIKESPSDNYWDEKSQRRTETPAEKKARQDKEFTDKVNIERENTERKRQEINRKTEAVMNSIYASFYAAQAATDARNQLIENSKLSGNYNSAEELEADFYQKYHAINQNVQDWENAKNQEVQAQANLYFNDGTASGAALSNAAGTIGALINEEKAEKEEKKRKEQLQAQRQQALDEMNQKKWNAILELRKQLLKEFPDGGTPLSAHKIETEEVYFFAYWFDNETINKTETGIYVSNVFAVAKYSDGTWMFKNALVNDIKTKTSKTSPITLMGYYTDKSTAERMRNSLISLAPKAQIKPYALDYKLKAASQAKGTSGDFWETEQSGANKTDGFWEAGKSTPSKKAKEEEKETKTTSDNYWNN